MCSKPKILKKNLEIFYRIEYKITTLKRNFAHVQFNVYLFETDSGKIGQ